MTIAAGLFISGRDWLVPVLVLVLVLVVGLIVSYRRTPGDFRIRLACFFLKLLGILALAACLLEPLWTGERARPGANLLAVVADNSQGLQIHDAGNPQSRGESLRAKLSGENAGWLSSVEENFQLRRYTFDTHLQAAENFAELNFTGRATSLGAALRTLAERFKNRPLAGVLLFTDGNATDLAGALPDFAGLPPVYPVLVGREGSVRDIAVQNVAVSRSAFEDAPITIQADVSAAGFAGEQLVVQLLDAAGKKVEEQSQSAPRGGENAAFRFQVKPEKPGVSFYRLRAAARNELEQFENPKVSTEATLANNTRIVVADRGAGPYRVLYVAGRPNWEFKFLNRALADDDQVQLTALIRIAKREPKFDFRGRAGETSNPLFRGFGNQAKDEVEQYDKPVLIRLNTRDATELAGGFPKTADELYGYHAVIVDDLETEFFTADQQLLLQKFVSERGGGFLMLGGMESFREGQFARTPVGDMLPVYLDRAPEAKTPSGLRLDLTREGMLQPWARLNKTEAEERKRIDDMPPFLVLNPAREVKPGATAIATVKDADNRDYPALVAQRFGHGRTAALLIGDLWHWGFRDAEAHADMDKSWRQTVRWLVSDVPNRVELAVEKTPGDPNQAVKLRVKVRDEKFQPLNNASVSLQVRTATATNKTAALRLIAEPALTEPGVYEATFVPREEGGFHVEASVTNSVGASVGRAEAGWAAEFAAEEFRSLNPNKALLEQIAARTGGEVVPLDKVAAFAQSLPTRRAPITEPWTFPLWHTPAMFLFALACFVAEWGLRRTKGLA